MAKLCLPAESTYLGSVDAYECSAAEALKRWRRNPVAQWNSGWGQQPADGTAWARITAREYFTPGVSPSFQIKPDDRVFAIGSCFAREIEAVMERLGFESLSRTNRFDGCALRATGFAHDYMNRYNPWSIANELRWALDPQVEFPVEALQELPDGRWLDPHSTPVLEYTTYEETLARRKIMAEIVSNVSSCRLVVITLGLIETFLDTYTRLYTNHAPWLTSHPGRFRFRVLSFAETMDALYNIHWVLCKFGHSDVQIIVTASPIPLQSTFTGEDVVIANTHSKAVVRAAAGEWASALQNVHYFPSFEVVMNSTRGAAWRDDGRHVRPELVKHIMQTFTIANLERPGS